MLRWLQGHSPEDTQACAQPPSPLAVTQPGLRTRQLWALWGHSGPRRSQKMGMAGGPHFHEVPGPAPFLDLSTPRHLISPTPGAPGSGSQFLLYQQQQPLGAVSGFWPLSVCVCLLSPPVNLGLSPPGARPPTPCSRSRSLSLQPLSSANPGCHGNTAAGTRWWLGAGSPCCRSLHHFRCQAPSRHSGWGSCWGCLASPGLEGFTWADASWGTGGTDVGVRMSHGRQLVARWGTE